MFQRGEQPKTSLRPGHGFDPAKILFSTPPRLPGTSLEDCLDRSKTSLGSSLNFTADPVTVLEIFLLHKVTL